MDRWHFCTMLFLIVTTSNSKLSLAEELHHSFIPEVSNKLSMKEWMNLQISIDVNYTSVFMNDSEVYNHRRNFSNDVNDLKNSTGIHLLVIHETSFRVLFKSLFKTVTLAADKHLLRRLVNVHQGRIVIVAGSSYYTAWLRQLIRDFFSEIGSHFGEHVALGEAWCFVFYNGYSKSDSFDLSARDYNKIPSAQEIENLNYVNETRRKVPIFENVSKISIAQKIEARDEERISEFVLRDFKVVYEGTSLLREYRFNRPSSPFRVECILYSQPAKACLRHEESASRELNDFCSNFDGINPFCRCHERMPILPIRQKPFLRKTRTIPVAIVTTGKSNQVLRQIRQIREQGGGYEVPILLCVDGGDGKQEEVESLARLMGVEVVFNEANAFEKGTRYRINEQIRWSVEKVVSFYSKVDYVIILEDDLDLAPDFMNYFQQVSRLMEADQSILFANAYSYNAFSHTAYDPTRVYLVQSYPYYGWMMRSKDMKEILSSWAPPGMVADWDIYLGIKYSKNRVVVIPEVPRTKHVSGGGAHVTGYEQEVHHDIRPLNREPKVRLRLNRSPIHLYRFDLTAFILSSQQLTITNSPCTYPSLSTKKPGGKYVLYANSSATSVGKEFAYTVIARCFGFYAENSNEKFEGTMYRKFFHNEILIVLCPSSPFCTIPLNSPLIFTPSEEDLNESVRNPFIREIRSNSVTRRVFSENDPKKNTFFSNDTDKQLIMAI